MYDGDTIVGNGYVLNITTQCYCSSDDTPASLEAVGIPAAYSSDFSSAGRGIHSRNLFISNLVVNNVADETVHVHTALFNTPLCGGLNTTGTPVCETVLHSHKNAIIQMEYMTDGTTASIAQKDVRVREETDKADLNNWAHFALQAVLGQGVQTSALPAQVPGMISPILWWATVDLMAIDPAMFEAGMETFFTLMFRAGVQRTYATSGAKCVRNIVDVVNTALKMEQYGVDSSLAAVCIQLIFNVFAIVAFIPWLLSNVPASPAIRAQQESIYFTTLLADSNLGDNLKGLCNAPTHAIWQSLDIVVRIGESIMTQDEEIGHITMDKPKVVRPLVNARKYA